MLQENYEKFTQVAENVSVVWTKLSKEYGWPHRKGLEDLMREGKAIRSTIRYGGPLVDKNNEETQRAIEWILRRWNWNKSPAPLNLLTSQTQWKSFHMVMARVEEENLTAINERMSSLFEWSLQEMQRNIKKGMPATSSRKNIEDLAKILGKTSSLEDKELIEFQRFCEELESKFS